VPPINAFKIAGAAKDGAWAVDGILMQPARTSSGRGKRARTPQTFNRWFKSIRSAFMTEAKKEARPWPRPDPDSGARTD